MKSETRILAEKIKALNGMSLVRINVMANELIGLGKINNRLEALQYLLELEGQNQHHPECHGKAQRTCNCLINPALRGYK